MLEFLIDKYLRNIHLRLYYIRVLLCHFNDKKPQSVDADSSR